MTFERREEEQDVLPEWAHGACGWMVAVAPGEEAACRHIVRDVERCGLRLLEIDDVREVLTVDEVEKIDGHLAANLREIGPGEQTVWGTIRGYKGEGEA